MKKLSDTKKLDCVTNVRNDSIRHAELDSASQVNPLLSLRDTLPQGRENTLCAIPTSKSIKVVPMSTDRATCVAHDKNLSTYRLNVLETDKNLTHTLSRICKFAYSSLTNSTLSQRERVKYGFTLAEVFSPCRKVKLNFGFTLAETLITLGIIGVVAALTLPTLISNYKKHVVETRLKAAYSQLSQAIVLSETQNGEYTSWDLPPSQADWRGQIRWLEKYIAPYLEHTKISRATLNPSATEILCYIRLKNGTIVYFHSGSYADFYIDINGLQGPNKLGYDIFVVNLNVKNLNIRNSKNLFFYGIQHVDNRTNALNLCATSRPGFCGAIIQYDGWKIKEDYPYKF